MKDIEIIKKISTETGNELKEGDDNRGYQLNETGDVIRLSLVEAGLKNLEKIINFLKQLNSLTDLDLSENSISNLDLIKALRNLTSLNIYHNGISDLSPLQSLVNLNSLSLQGNEFNDLSFLLDMVNQKNSSTLCVGVNRKV